MIERGEGTINANAEKIRGEGGGGKCGNEREVRRKERDPVEGHLEGG